MSVSEEYAPGQWRPAVPMPFLGVGFLRCHCGRFFIGGWRRSQRARRRYERHYRRAHLPTAR